MTYLIDRLVSFQFMITFLLVFEQKERINRIEPTDSFQDPIDIRGKLEKDRLDRSQPTKKSKDNSAWCRRSEEAELVGLMESSNIPDDTVGKELLASEKKPTISEFQLLRDVFDAHDLPRQFTKKLLSGMDTKVIRAISAKVAEVIPDFFDKFVAAGGVYRHSTSGKATKRDCVDGLYKVAKLHKFI